GSQQTVTSALRVSAMAVLVPRGAHGLACAALCAADTRCREAFPGISPGHLPPSLLGTAFSVGPRGGRPAEKGSPACWVPTPAAEAPAHPHHRAGPIRSRQSSFPLE